MPGLTQFKEGLTQNTEFVVPSGTIFIPYPKNNMNTEFEVGQKVTTPKGDAIIETINGRMITVKFKNGTTETFPIDKVSDNSDAG